MHRTGDLYGHFQTLEQQKDTATLGMWIFLVTEVLFFGGLFLAYTINRSAFSTAASVRRLLRCVPVATTERASEMKASSMSSSQRAMSAQSAR